jgi:hypothetical protein
MNGISLLFLDVLSSSSDETGSSGGDESDLLTLRGESADSRGVTNMLLVTTTMRMLDGVHSDSSNSGPGTLPLCLHLVEDVTSLADWLVDSATSGNDSDHSSAGTWDGSSGATWKSDSGLLEVLTVPNDNG